MGVHTGEPLATEEGYVGIDVHRAARIAAVEHGGQVLVSQSTCDFAGLDELRDLGEHRLKDLTAPERIYQLGDGEFPLLKSLNATNLPIAGNPLVGREREVGELMGLLGDSARLVTVTGPGGTGKTRLGLQVAGESVEAFRGGVFFVPLAGVPEADLVAGTIASTVGVHDLGELRDRQALLLLDNFEHLLDAAPAVATLLTATPSVKVLATSRAPLRVEGEREYPLDPLPDDDAIELLTERALAVRPDFAPDEATREICRRLEGLPLAIELAASRLRSLGSSALLERLERRLPLLTSGRRDVPERQRTLRATIEWSYDLLEPEQQRLFARLGVFVTFTLDAAEAVAGAGLDAVDALVEASLLKHLGGDRYLMLETIRELALERLEAGGEGDEIRRHLEFLTELAERANLTIEADGPMRHDLVIPERNNIRAALEWALSSGEAETGLRLAVILENFWVSAADPVEGSRWIKELLSRAEEPEPSLHALAFQCLGNCAIRSGDREGGIAFYEQSLAEFRALGDELRAAISLYRVAHNRANDEPERARQIVGESLEFFRRAGFAKGEAQCLALLGDLELQSGALEQALDFFDRSMALCRETGFHWWEMAVLVDQASALFELERPEDAAVSIVQALEIARRLEDRIVTVYSLAYLGRAAAEAGDEEHAGRLWGAIEAEIERTPMPGWESERDELAEPIFARAGATFEAARAEGRGLSLQDAAELALSYREGRPS
jgi:predicted ATPase